jgi:hypothetical protein
VLRGGYGVYHQRATAQPYLQQLANQPFGLIRLVQPVTTGDFANPFPPDPGAFPQFLPYFPFDPANPGAPTLSPQIIDPKVRPPIFQRYSLNLQTQLPQDMVLEVGYAGMHGTDMLIWHTINQAALVPGNTTVANVQQRVPFQGFSAGGMFDIQSNGFAWYNALQASLTKRFSHGLQFLASYTFARDLANVFESTISPNGGQVYGNNNDPRSNYGPDAFVRPHRFVFSGVYELPGPRNHRSLAGQFLANWKLAGVVTIQSGHLLPVISNTGTNAYGIPTDFAELVPGCKLSTSGSVQSRLNNWINQACVAPFPVIGDDGMATGFGNSRMGILHAPGQANTDLSIMKVFSVTERAKMEFRTEFFNVLNKAVFNDPDNTVSDTGSFGHITSTISNPRVMQFALKLSF